MIRRESGNVKQKSVIHHTIFWGWTGESVQLQRSAEHIRGENQTGADEAAVYAIRSGGAGAGERRYSGAGLYIQNRKRPAHGAGL